MFLDDACVLDRTTFDDHIEELDEALTRMETPSFQERMQKIKWPSRKLSAQDVSQLQMDIVRIRRRYRGQWP